ncbi:MAG: hypothetical protein ACKOXP_08825 [Flavobacteriales bacterium]
MKQLIHLLFICLLSINGQAQIKSSELGLEAYGGGSNLGGSLGGEIKYAAKLPNNLVVGPSFRLQRTWSNYYSMQSHFNIWGGGAFAHLRIQDKVFFGTEFQMLHSPYNFTTFQTGSKKWAPTLFVGGGFYLKLGPKVNLNLALFYDLINAQNSPFRSSYNFKVKNQAGQVVKILPIIYRITFFIPLSK